MSSFSPKYNRTFHVPWSKGATNDDKIANDVSCLLNNPIIITEKIDGSNTSLEASGCFARTHAGPPTHKSFDGLKSLHGAVKHLIPDNIQIFGEWCYALHSISYDSLPGYFLMFGVREIISVDKNDYYWYSWEEVEEWAKELQVPTVPVLWKGTVFSQKELQILTESLVNQPSVYGSTREGLVIRSAGEFKDKDFAKSIMKWVRANHVQTSEHWKDQEIIRNKLKISGSS